MCVPYATVEDIVSDFCPYHVGDTVTLLKPITTADKSGCYSVGDTLKIAEIILNERVSSKYGNNITNDDIKKNYVLLNGPCFKYVLVDDTNDTEVYMVDCDEASFYIAEKDEIKPNNPSKYMFTNKTHSTLDVILYYTIIAVLGTISVVCGLRSIVMIDIRSSDNLNTCAPLVLIAVVLFAFTLCMLVLCDVPYPEMELAHKYEIRGITIKSKDTDKAKERTVSLNKLNKILSTILGRNVKCKSSNELIDVINTTNNVNLIDSIL